MRNKNKGKTYQVRMPDREFVNVFSLKTLPNLSFFKKIKSKKKSNNI